MKKKFREKFKLFISNETDVVWDEKYSVQYPKDYEAACNKLELGGENLKWLKDNLHKLAGSFVDLSLGMRRTLVLIIDKGFKNNFKSQSIILSYFLDSLELSSREIARTQIDRLAHENWLTIDYSYGYDEHPTTMSLSSLAFDEPKELLKTISECFPKEEWHRMIIELDFSLSC